MPRSADAHRRLLATYETPPPGGRNGSGAFLRLFAGSQGLLLGLGALLLTVEVTPAARLAADEAAHRVTFRLEPEVDPVEPAPDPSEPPPPPRRRRS